MPATITTLQELISQYDAGLGPPQGTDAASELDDYIRQLQGFLVNFLQVSFNATDGTLKPTAITQATFTGGIIPGSALEGDINGNLLLANSVGYTQLAKWDNGAGQAAVKANTIDDDAIESRHIKDGEVGAGKLADGAVDAAAVLADDVVTTDAILNSAVTSAKIAGLDGSKIDANTLPPTAIKSSLTILPLASSIGLPVIVGPTSAGSQIATIGGALSATLVGNVLTFALASAVGSGTGTVYTFTNSDTGASVVSATVTPRTNWSKVTGDSIVAWNASTSVFDVTEEAVFIVFFELAGYSVESFRAVLSLNGSAAILGNDVFIPIGTGGTSMGFGIVQLSASGTIGLGYQCGRVQAANGLGYSTLSSPVFGRLLLIAIA